MLIVITWFILICSWIFFIFGAFVIFSCFIGTIRFNDYFVKLHAIKISNIYGISSILFAISISSKNLLTFLQFLIYIIINILSTLIISHTISRIVLIKNIQTTSISRKKYNEMNTKQQEQESEQQNQEDIDLEEEVGTNSEEESN